MYLGDIPLLGALACYTYLYNIFLFLSETYFIDGFCAKSNKKLIERAHFRHCFS